MFRTTGTSGATVGRRVGQVGRGAPRHTVGAGHLSENIVVLLAGSGVVVKG